MWIILFTGSFLALPHSSDTFPSWHATLLTCVSAVPVPRGIFPAIGSVPRCPHGEVSLEQWNSSSRCYYSSSPYSSIAYITGCVVFKRASLKTSCTPANLKVPHQVWSKGRWNQGDLQSLLLGLYIKILKIFPLLDLSRSWISYL